MSDEALIHVVDDDEASRDSLAFLFGAHAHKVKVYASAAEFLAAIAVPLTGIIVTDVRMPEMNGIELLRRLREKGIANSVIVITGHGDVPLAVEAMKAGASDFIEKPFDEDLILRAARYALRSSAAEGEQNAERAASQRKLATLSARERQVLDGLVAGHANKVIAFDLGISPRTVEVYRAKVMTKMEAESFSELVRMSLLAAGSA
jgi:two-component system, LuxR family, response regulator FixJ